MAITTHEDLVAWQKAMGLARSAYAATKTFPKEEVFGLTSQIRRAAVSVPANIAEGAARGTTKEFLQFLMIARGSLAELSTLLALARDLGYIQSHQHAAFANDLKEVAGLLGGLVKALRGRALSSQNTKHNSQNTRST
jgi:four helix bundle protein